METAVIEFLFSALAQLAAQYPDAAWLVTALSVVMTVCGLCAVATVWMPVPKEPTGLYAVFYRWAHALAAHFGQNKGVVEVGANSVIDAFREKSDMDGDLINIGFMVFQPELFDLIEGDETVFEKGPLTKLVAQKQLVGYIHQGFWQCMDTLREKQKLEQLWASGNAPWKVWEK